ncbi:hypothetical protein [Novosphingobium resinovorum]|uniref:hypothetical protein n=1 Tax=Novosphingobium resinovorum TaxID=158500 RepID=UPI002ECFF7F9|nr:hypothetical protein [Novosphingobium resinovorum]
MIASDMHLKMGAAGLEPQPGVLKWVDRRTGVVSPLYPSRDAAAGRPDWGDPSCPGEIGAVLLPHGIHLSKRGDGIWQLLVVNHGGRESVEFFELGARKGKWSARWRGCVVAPASSHLNDVAALPGGGFLVSTMHMGANEETRSAAVKAAKGENTGFLWRWTPGSGISRQAGSDAPMPNGVQVDAAGRYAYVNTASKGGDVRKLDLASGQVVGTVAVPNPDNGSWTADGRLLVAGVAAGPKPMHCFKDPGAPCPAPSEVYAIDVETMQAERIFAHSGAPINAATVAVQAGDDLLVGSCFGDTIVTVRNAFKRPKPS